MNLIVGIHNHTRAFLEDYIAPRRLIGYMVSYLTRDLIDRFSMYFTPSIMWVNINHHWFPVQIGN